MEILEARYIIREAANEEDDMIRHSMVKKAMCILRRGGHLPPKGSII